MKRINGLLSLLLAFLMLASCVAPNVDEGITPTSAPTQTEAPLQTPTTEPTPAPTAEPTQLPTSTPVPSQTPEPKPPYEDTLPTRSSINSFGAKADDAEKEWSFEGNASIKDGVDGYCIMLSDTGYANHSFITDGSFIIFFCVNLVGSFAVSVNNTELLLVNDKVAFAADGAQICDVEEKKDISVAVIYDGEKLYYEINDKKYEHIYELDEPERVMFYCEKSGASANIADIFANKYEKEIENYMKLPDMVSAKMKIIGVDEANKTITVKDYTKNCELVIYCDDEPITVKRQYEIDDLEYGQWVFIYGGRNDNDKIITSGDIGIQDEVTDERKLIDGVRVDGKIEWEDVTEATSDLRLKSIDGKRAYTLNVADEIYTMQYAALRPFVFAFESGSFEDYRVGMYATVTATNQDGKLVMVKADVEDIFGYIAPYFVCVPNGPSGQTVEQVREKTQKAVEMHGFIEKNLIKRMPVNMTIENEMCAPNDEVTVRIEAYAKQRPSQKAMLYTNYVENNMSECAEIIFEWKNTGEQKYDYTLYTAEIKLPTNKLGMHLFKWECDIGGKIDTYSRSYAVVDETYAVFVVNNLSVPSMEAEYQKNYIPYGKWVDVTVSNNVNWGEEYDELEWEKVSRIYRQYGIMPNFQLIYNGWDTAQISEESAEFQRAILEGHKTIAGLLGFDESYLNYGDYSMTTQMNEIARELGYKYVHSLVANNHIDGGFAINQLGKATQPYYMSSDDYRKTGNEENQLIGFTQGSYHDLLTIKYFSHYHCGIAELYTVEFTQPREFESIETAFSRVYDYLEALYQNRLSNDVPFIIPINLQFETSADGILDGNKIMFERQLDMVREGGAVFVTSNGVADYWLNHYEKQPQTVTYLTDFFAGMTARGKPSVFADCMYIENDRFFAISQKGSHLPTMLYDYTTEWDYPEVGNENMERTPYGGGTIPDEDNKYQFDITPKIVDFRGVEIEESRAEYADYMLITLKVTSEKQLDSFPIALFDIPRAWLAGNGWYSGEGCEFVPVRAPFSGMLCGFAVCDIKQGENVFTVRIDSAQTDALATDFTLNDVIHVSVIERDVCNAYVSTVYPWAVDCVLTLPEGVNAKLHFSKGTCIELDVGENPITIPNGWVMIEGLTMEQMREYLTVTKPE